MPCLRGIALNKQRIRKLYDEVDHLVNNLNNIFPSNLSVDIGATHWNEICYDVGELEFRAKQLLNYIANTIIPDVEAHPEKENKKPGGVFIDGERQ